MHVFLPDVGVPQLMEMKMKNGFIGDI
jgi:hypothetical protein